MCGEQASSICRVRMSTGSSPRVRGAVHVAGVGGPEGGIIPACAGSRARFSIVSELPWDHPRVCGEQSPNVVRSFQPQGSSPRVRGAVCDRLVEVDGLGIIPACAGSRCSSRSWFSPFRDHPRVCGEQRPSRAERCRRPGSSPRVRGADRYGRQQHGHRGIIPACAGSSGRQCI